MLPSDLLFQRAVDLGALDRAIIDFMELDGAGMRYEVARAKEAAETDPGRFTDRQRDYIWKVLQMLQTVAGLREEIRVVTARVIRADMLEFYGGRTNDTEG